ncbi:hypothetical protein X772_00740 [Mesorhizobium sp. LSJC280B00]|nr:hypothetical protein X772_00740 [Mesorhizobium sp. LSJC280B00]
MSTAAFEISAWRFGEERARFSRQGGSLNC